MYLGVERKHRCSKAELGLRMVFLVLHVLLDCVAPQQGPECHQGSLGLS